MRDVSAIDPHGLDVPCGKGQARLPELFRALVNNDVRPLMMLEYEHDFDNPMPYLIESVNFINAECGRIIKEKEQAARLGEAINLYAGSAKITDGMTVQNTGKNTAIHGWNSPQQSITWTTRLTPGNYQVIMHYSQPYMGSAATLTCDGEELALLFPSTFTWYDYRTITAGVIKVKTAGEVQLTLRGVQNGIRRDEKGKLKACESLPDVCGITLQPTSLETTSKPVDILKTFKGTRLFNGHDFSGWEGNDGESSLSHFRIAKRCIVGGSMTAALKHNQFVRTVRKYRNFELRLKYQVRAADDSYNGGVQFRSTPCTVPGRSFEMVGYQADIISWKTGALYDEQRRWNFLGMQLGKPAGYKPDRWNQYIIRCEGPRVRIWLNGTKTTDYIEPFTEEPFEGIGTINQDGHIALQIHEGKACEIWYKDIEIEELP